MAVTVSVPAPLRHLTAGASQVRVHGTTVLQALEDLESRYPGLHERIRDGSGQVRRYMNVYVNDSDIRFEQGLATPVGDDDGLSIVPAIAGGTGRPPALRADPDCSPGQACGHRRRALKSR